MYINILKIKDIPKEERPRERLIKYGVENLSNDFIRFFDEDVYYRINAIKLIIKKQNCIKEFEDLCLLALASNVLGVSNMQKSGDVRFATEKELKRKNKDIVSLFV